MQAGFRAHHGPVHAPQFLTISLGKARGSLIFQDGFQASDRSLALGKCVTEDTKRCMGNQDLFAAGREDDFKTGIEDVAPMRLQICIARGLVQGRIIQDIVCWSRS
jgi:hypothetical protein